MPAILPHQRVPGAPDDDALSRDTLTGGLAQPVMIASGLAGDLGEP